MNIDQRRGMYHQRFDNVNKISVSRATLRSWLAEREKQIPYANTYTWNLKQQQQKSGHEEPRGKMGIKTQTY